MELSELCLRNGIKNWSKTWDKDFHSGFYDKLQARLSGKDRHAATLAYLVDNLTTWKAIRPVPKKTVSASLRKALPKLLALRKQILSRTRRTSFGKLNWSDVRGLFDQAMQIKPTISRSPVFASKLCHFLAPKCFPVFDRQFVGGRGSYEDYWKECQVAWNGSTQIQDRLKATLKDKIGPEPSEHYPYAVKIVELCIAGCKQGS